MMADEQPNLSADVQVSDAAATAPDSAEPTQESSEDRSWFRRLFGGRRSQETEASGGDQEQPGGASKTLQLTEEELQRRVQAETDRREAKRAQEARAAERRRLRDDDPWQFAEQERQAEQAQVGTEQIQSFLSGVGAEHDRVSIDPLIEVLPKAERDRILNLQGAGVGLNGRKLVVNEALKSLQKHWEAEGEKKAEAKLRRNPAFRKQLLAEARGEFVEPELLPAYSSSAADKTMSGILRQYYDLPTPREHNQAG
jgi:hypothetical protein